MSAKFSLAGLVAGLALAGPASSQALVKQATGALPAETGFDALPVLETLADGDIAWLDLVLSPSAWPGLEAADGTFSTPDRCSFGMIETAGRIQVPTGSNHLLMSVRTGAPDLYAANGLSCEYDAADPGGRGQMRLTGCYYVRVVSIPTARELVLNPLPASACALHD